ncbi:MAG TPA: hypothetical protein ENN80_14810, partial [Candidatus Hydrogenedentes bacterium]|nr:hypothetical protein [Candidatus Hydrogenedentota bacterium]
SWAATCAIGSSIYVCGGADYDAKRFYTVTDRSGAVEHYGSLMHALDSKHPEAGWKALKSCPGTPRCCAGTAFVDGKLYLIGGVATTRAEGALCNVVDSWLYDPERDAWKRLRDMPISGSGSSSTPNLNLYKGRYLVLPCGYQYESYMKPNGETAPKYGTPSTVERTWKNHPRFETTHYYNHCYVYDVRTDLYGTATALPFDDVASITIIVRDIMYILPGETAGFVWEGEYFGHHPEFVLKGDIKELDWQ